MHSMIHVFLLQFFTPLRFLVSDAEVKAAETESKNVQVIDEEIIW
jgi:hypothetical protein